MLNDETVNVRYMVDDVDESIAFYTKLLGFEVLTSAAPAFADVRRGNLRLLLSGPASSAAPGHSGHTSRTRSHNVMTRSKRCATNSSRCFVRFALMSMHRFRITRTAFGCNGFGLLPADSATTAPSVIRSSSASAICDRALLPVHKNRILGRSPNAPVVLGAATAGDSARPGCREPPASPRRSRHRISSAR